MNKNLRALSKCDFDLLVPEHFCDQTDAKFLVVDNVIDLESFFDGVATGAAKIATAEHLVIGFSA